MALLGGCAASKYFLRLLCLLGVWCAHGAHNTHGTHTPHGTTHERRTLGMAHARRATSKRTPCHRPQSYFSSRDVTHARATQRLDQGHAAAVPDGPPRPPVQAHGGARPDEHRGRGRCAARGVLRDPPRRPHADPDELRGALRRRDTALLHQPGEHVRHRHHSGHLGVCVPPSSRCHLCPPVFLLPSASAWCALVLLSHTLTLSHSLTHTHTLTLTLLLCSHAPSCHPCTHVLHPRLHASLDVHIITLTCTHSQHILTLTALPLASRAASHWSAGKGRRRKTSPSWTRRRQEARRT